MSGGRLSSQGSACATAAARPRRTQRKPAHWLVSSAIRLSSTTPLSTRCRASSSTACHGLLRNLPLRSVDAWDRMGEGGGALCKEVQAQYF